MAEHRARFTTSLLIASGSLLCIMCRCCNTTGSQDNFKAEKSQAGDHKSQHLDVAKLKKNQTSFCNNLELCFVQNKTVLSVDNFNTAMKETEIMCWDIG